MQRKVFRIEQMIPGRRGLTPRVPEKAQLSEEAAAPRQGDDTRDGESGERSGLTSELTSIRDALARNKRDLASLVGDDRRIARATNELGAAVDGMEKATQKILKAVEVIDDGAKALTASLHDEFKRGVAQDIQDHVVEIYESCNFQDIAGQRIGKAIATLTAIERQVTGMLARFDGIDAPATPRMVAPQTFGRGLLNGPRLEGDAGHASQRDIDKLFG